MDIRAAAGQAAEGSPDYDVFMDAAGFIDYLAEWWHWSCGDRHWAFQTYGGGTFWEMARLAGSHPPEREDGDGSAPGARLPIMTTGRCFYRYLRDLVREGRTYQVSRGRRPKNVMVSNRHIVPLSRVSAHTRWDETTGRHHRDAPPARRSRPWRAAGKG